MAKYHIYMQKEGEAAPKDLESAFLGLKYYQSKGLSNKGEPKNIYYEEYADSERVRVYIPETVCLESTDITLTLYFKGENRRDVFDTFYAYIENGKILFWDDVRKRKVLMVLNGEVSLSDDIFIGSDVYMSADFTFKNLYGRSFGLEEEIPW